MGGESHLPVMLDEVLLGLNIDEDGIYLDCTFGRGGHSEAVLSRLGRNGRLLALDKDDDAVISKMAENLKRDPRFDIQQKSFARLQESVESRGLTGRISGMLMDLGVSSPQLDDPDRGFSFMADGPLDMRMDRSSTPSAAEWLKTVSENDLVSVLREYGEERFAKRIARAIIKNRKQSPIESTRQLVELIERSVPSRERNKHPATRSFQAIRIFINRELEDLKDGLTQAINVLRPTGRLVVIAFHSLEDRIVKRFIRDQSRGPRYPEGIPISNDDWKPLVKMVGKAIKPNSEEVQRNPRARSAILRVAEKLV